MGMALEFNLKRFVWRMIPSQQMSRIILNIYIYNISYITYLYKLPPTPHQDSFLHVQCCKAQVASLATDLRGQLGQLQFPKAYPRYFTASMLASESSWWRPSRLYRRPRSHSRIRDSTVSDSTVLPGPSYLGLAKVHKHALSHACLCTLARPKFDPISWRPVLVASAELHSIPECTAGGSLSIRWGMVWCISPIPQDNSMVVSRCPWMKATIGSTVGFSML